MFLAQSFRGIEDICSKEIINFTKSKTHLIDGAVLFDCSDKDIQKLSYLSKTPNRILKIISSHVLKGIKDKKYKKGMDPLKEINDLIIDENLKDHLKDKSFKTESLYSDTSLKIPKLSITISEVIRQRLNNRIDYKSPDINLVFYFTADTLYVCKDLSFDLSKRDYKLFTYGRDIKGTLASSLLLWSGFDNTKTLLDPFCVNGTISIEAAFIKKSLSPWYYNKDRFSFDASSYDDCEDNNISQEKDFDLSYKKTIVASAYQQRFVKASQKNAAVAGVKDTILFKKLDPDELYLSLNDSIKNNFDIIIANLPIPTKRNSNGIKKLYKTFLDQLETITDQNTMVLVFCQKIKMFKDLLSESKFKLKEQREILLSSETIHAIKFSLS